MSAKPKSGSGVPPLSQKAQSRDGSATLGKPPPNTSSPEGAKEGGELPKGWRLVNLGDVAESMKNGIYKPASSYADDGLACLRMYNIEEGKVAWRDIKRMRLDEGEIREYELLPGDLLVHRVNSRELVGKAVAIPSGLERCVFESKNIRVRLRRDLVAPEFASYRLLLAYEAAVRGWLAPADGKDFVGSDVNFAKLKAAGVRFYDDTKTALPPLPPPKVKPPTLDLYDL